MSRTEKNANGPKQAATHLPRHEDTAPQRLRARRKAFEPPPIPTPTNSRKKTYCIRGRPHQPPVPFHRVHQVRGAQRGEGGERVLTRVARPLACLAQAIRVDRPILYLQVGHTQTIPPPPPHITRRNKTCPRVRSSAYPGPGRRPRGGVVRREREVSQPKHRLDIARRNTTRTKDWEAYHHRTLPPTCHHPR